MGESNGDVYIKVIRALFQKECKCTDGHGRAGIRWMCGLGRE